MSDTQKKEPSPQANGKSDANSGMRVTVLRSEDHGACRIRETSDWSFASDGMFISLDAAETVIAMREYPLFFIEGKEQIFALVGMEKGVNAYIGEDGRWLASYIPARLRAHPFVLVNKPGDENAFVLAVKADAPEVNETEGQNVFSGDTPTEFVKNRMQLLTSLVSGEKQTATLVTQLRTSGLLEKAQFNARFPTGKNIVITGLERVDEKKLHALPADALAALRDSGALTLAYAHLFSMANLRVGPLIDRYPELKNDPAAQAQGQSSDVVEKS